MTVLLVDDSPVMRRYVARTLQMRGVTRNRLPWGVSLVYGADSGTIHLEGQQGPCQQDDIRVSGL